MRAVVFTEFGGTPELRDVPDPVPSADGVVIRVETTGVCRSDAHGWLGHDDGIALPHVPGHELVGRIAAVGPEVTRFRIGERVTVPFVSACGRCPECAGGNGQVCRNQTQPGFTHWGSFAERVALHAADTNLVAVTDLVEDSAAAALGCRFATAYRALHARAGLRSGEWVTVVGVGGVGLSAVQIAVAAGAKVVAVDRTPAALELARGLGAAHTVLAGGGERSDGGVDGGVDVAAEVHDLTGGGSHVAVDAVGSESTCADAIHSLRRRGRHVQVGLLPAVGGHPAVPMDRVIGWELDVLGSHGMASVDYPDMLRLVEAGTLRPQDLVERVVGLTEGAQLLPALDTAAPVGVTLIDPRVP